MTDPLADQLPACLVVLDDPRGELLGARLDLAKSPTRIGRTAPAEVVIRMAEISRRHCQFELRDGAWWLVDESSTCGVWVNDEKIAYERRLASGDRIGIALVKVRFLAGPDLDARCEQERREIPARGAPLRGR